VHNGHAFLDASSLAVIGNASGESFEDKETRRKPLGFAGDAGVLRGLNGSVDRNRAGGERRRVVGMASGWSQ
jgi:hypothetical protein